ncbi:uncharacterized protein BX663DRAFT_554428 [Cokeromyces recurvatus]|uniref:uncharacterized protein n=1 Tax=Cokeromyces recurvatus TaxID=90255 RepID=UPI00221F5D79|nr:uncharacterized protein BX663DRAFT_554428 [Cokeromyces recurvatus]KAI7899979.1 hypothetical protein BX663DRAFT_554428 [Cokeromyces recurvatus]
MVARRPHSPYSSSNNSVGQSSIKSRQKSSLHKQNEKITPSSSISTKNTINQKKTKQSSEGIAHSSQPEQAHRSSDLITIETPRLSIAERFMSNNFVSSTPIINHKSNAYTSNHSVHVISSNSNLPDTQTKTSTDSKLSVADRFMNIPTKSSTSSILNVQQYKDRLDSALLGKPSSAKITSSSTSNIVPGRLTIADTFMKTSSTSLTPTSSRSCTTSFADETDIKTNYIRKPSQVHPLDKQSPKLSLFDNSNSTHFLGLDLTLSSSSPSSSVRLNRGNSRPWGSQDTLVHYHQLDKKKSIYSQFKEMEKTNNQSPLSVNNLFLNSTIFSSTNIDNQSYNEASIAIGRDSFHKYEEYYQQKDQHWGGDEDDIEKSSYYENHNPVGSTAKLTNKKEKPKEDDKSCGFWIGCCFISCGRKPSPEAIERERKRREQRKLQQSKNRGCGRRGWVLCTFLSLIIFVFITYFLWPRTPLIRIEGASLISATKVSETKQGIMVGNVAFESEWLVNVTVDNRQNHIPTRLVQVQVIAKDALTGLIIGKGTHNEDMNPEHIILAPDTISTIQLPIRVDYQARDSTDATFVNLVKACSPKHPIIFNNLSEEGLNDSNNTDNSKHREVLPMHFWITLHFFGLDWLGYKPTVIATPATGGFACPQT